MLCDIKIILTLEPDELFMATHTNKKGEWVDSRARETYVSYSFNLFYIYILIF